MKEVLYLYGTSACHLCEVAEKVIGNVLSQDYFDITVIDIAESDAMIECYGTRIPVLQVKKNQDEIGWPFDEAQLMSFIEKSLFTG